MRQLAEAIIEEMQDLNLEERKEVLAAFCKGCGEESDRCDGSCMDYVD